MKKVIFTLMMAALVSASFAQESAKTKTWTTKGTVGLNISQSSFTNWAAGGQNSLNWIGTLDYQANYAKDNFKWDNTLSTSLGYSYFNFKDKPIKTDDKIELTSLAGLKATEKLNYSLELAYRSQFANGFDYEVDSTHRISKFLAPGYITLGVGVEWVPNKYFSVNFAPVTGRVTIVNDSLLAQIGAFGVKAGYFNPNDSTEWIPGKHARYEFGARLVAKLDVPIAENISFNSKLELFSNYLDHPLRIDVDWQNQLLLKINSWLNCSIATHLIYDYDVPFYNIDPATGLSSTTPIEGSKVQFKEVLSLGVMFNI
ncbi:MAG: DUF3078 domain-containing protein [bacterium]|nr:DUF3078 domain-containing protein [Candidatus Limimorpha equi]